VHAQVRDTLGALAERFAALRPAGAPGLVLSRLARRTARPLALKRVVQYSPAWVKSQNRMASTSNQVRNKQMHPIVIPYPGGEQGQRKHAECLCQRDPRGCALLCR